MSEVRVVLLTVPDEDTGAWIARTLLEERLIACANLVPRVRSIYRWEGALQDDAEVLLILKSTAQRVSLLASRVRALHPYDLPEVIALAVSGGAEAYLDWVIAESS